jgi:uncharacterized protein
MSWRVNIVGDSATIGGLLAGVGTVAVLGIRSERYRDRPAHYVGARLVSAGLEIVPVPVYEPEVMSILGRRVYRRLADIPERIDLVDVFRRAVDIPRHVADILAVRPRIVWFQAGIRNDVVAETLARAGIVVIQDRCLMVEYSRRTTA